MRGQDLNRQVGLARVLSKFGYCSRSRAFELIRAGRVTVNEKIARNPEAPVQIDRDHIRVDGADLSSAEKIYLALNKPRGVITTASDEKGRETVYHLLNSDLPWVAPVGRLDKASEGLLLLTNDSEWAGSITSPETHLDKTYHVQVASLVDELVLRKLTGGVKDPSGERLQAKSARILRHGGKNTWLEIVLDEGKNRQIRRMFAALNIEVLRLVRVAIGPSALGDLAKGKSRRLTSTEKEMLDLAVKKDR